MNHLLPALMLICTSVVVRAADTDWSRPSNLNEISTSMNRLKLASARIVECRDSNLKSGEVGASLKDLNAALRLNPGNPGILLLRAFCFYQLDDYEHAFSDYDQVLRIQPNNTDALLMRSNCYEFLNDRQRAIQDLDRILELDPRSVDALYSRSLKYLRRGEYSIAILDLNKAIEIDPKYSPALYVRGLLKRKLGDEAGGTADIAAAEVLWPGITDFYANFKWN